MSLKELSKVNKRTRFKVYGWIREAERELSLNYIPTMISNIIILYTRDYDHFHVISDQCQASNNSKCLTKMTKVLPSCSYGYIVISSQSDTVCEWKIKICKLRGRIQIGITSSSSENKSIFRQKDGHHYAISKDSYQYNEITNCLHSNPSIPRLNEGDLVSICLNLKERNGQFSITVNDGNECIVYSNVKRGQDISYRLVVMLYKMHDSVEIKNFTK